jgi:HSP90 family molecular chaperone
VAKEGLSLDGDSEAAKAAKKEQAERFEPLLKWLGEDALKEHILKAEISERLASSPCALITSRFASFFILFFIYCARSRCLYRTGQYRYFFS